MSNETENNDTNGAGLSALRPLARSEKWSVYDYGDQWLINCSRGGFCVPQWLLTLEQVERIRKELSQNAKVRDAG